MFDRLDLITVGLLILIVVSRSRSNALPGHSQELDDLREDLKTLKQRLTQIESNIRSPNISRPFFSWFEQCFSHARSFSTSLIIYTFFLYFLHRCVFRHSTSQTIKLVHIVNVISYTVISSGYRAFQQICYSNVAWILLLFLVFRLCFQK